MGEFCMAVIMDCEHVFYWFRRLADSGRISCENIVLWRGHFNATGGEKRVNLTINGGEGEP